MRKVSEGNTPILSRLQAAILRQPPSRRQERDHMHLLSVDHQVMTIPYRSTRHKRNTMKYNVDAKAKQIVAGMPTELSTGDAFALEQEIESALDEAYLAGA
jgi:hypothetical protein